MVPAMLPGPPDRIDLTRVDRILVVKLRHHGDVLLTSPLFVSLKAQAPHAKIDALVYADTSEMLSQHPAIDEIHVIDRNWKNKSSFSRLKAEWGLFSGLRRRRYDLLVHLSEHPRGAWLARTLGCRYAVAPGYSSKPEFWRKSFTHLVTLPRNALRHMVEWNLDALRRIGVQPGPGERKLLLVPGDAAEAKIAALLGSQGLLQGGFVAVHPTSRWQFKCWPAAQVAAMIDTLVDQGRRVVLTAGPSGDEVQFVASVKKCSRRWADVVDLTGQLSLKELAAVLAKALLFVGVDSAPMHMAAAVGTPVVALFGPSGDVEWGPWAVPHRVVSSRFHPCRPCGNDGCGGGKVSDCLTRLPVDSVMSAIDEVLQEASHRSVQA
jgi:heptosyltransferase-3